jgi:DNA-binding CsgD family transcriptional regulator
VDALIERCYAGLDAAALRREVAARLKAVAGVDAAFVATVDPATLLFTSAVSEEPLIEAAPAFLANELGGRDVNRFTDLAAAPDPVRTLDQATLGDRDSSARHAAIMRPLGLGDELRVALRTRQACWGVMCLHRQVGATGFSPRDRDIVARIAPHVAEGLRRAVLAGQARDPHPALGHGVVILDASGSVTSVNDAAERWLAQIPESDWPSSCQLPLPLLAAAATAGHAEEHPAPAVRLRTVRGDWLSVHASPLHGGGEQSTVLILEEPGPGELTSLILASHGVTGAQARVVALVLRGYSTKQIVSQLAISQYTIQEHLRAVFDKLGVRSRQELAAALMRPGR